MGAVVAILLIAGLAFYAGGNLAGLVVMGSLIGMVLFVALGRDRRGRVDVVSSTDSTRRVLVMAHAGLSGPRLAELLELNEPDDGVAIHIVVPAEVNTVKRLTGDVDDEIAQAEEDGARIQRELSKPGWTVTASVGDSEPRLALEDTLRRFAADEVVVVNPPDSELSEDEWKGTRRALDDVPVPVRHLRG